MAPTQLQIKVNALNRLMKEHKLYQREADEQKERVEKLKQENGDEYELKKMNEVLQDSQQMVPELQKKIRSSVDSLKDLLNSGEIDEDTTAANQTIEEAEKILQ